MQPVSRALNAEMKKTHRSEFLKDVKKAFPDLVEEINSEHGLLHCEMHAFHRYVEENIKNNEKEKVIKSFQIIEHHFIYGNSSLTNAIGVSFLEHLDLGIAKGKPSWALEYFPKSLKSTYDELRKDRGI